MKKQLQKFFAKKKNNKGFTLIELIIVIAILAILIGIIGMASVRYVEKARESTDASMLDSISTAAQVAIVDPTNGVIVADDGATITVTAVANTHKAKFEYSGITFNGATGAFTSTDQITSSIEGDLSKDAIFKSKKYRKSTAVLTFQADGKVSDWNVTTPNN